MWFTVLLTLTVFAAIFGYDWVRRTSRKFKLLGKFPGPYPLPFLGNLPQLGFDADRASYIFLDMWKKYNKQNFHLTIGMEEWLMISDPADVAIVLNNQTELSKPKQRNAAVVPFFGYSVSTSDGDKWRFMRKLMSPSFHTKHLDAGLKVANQNCERLLNALKKHQDTNKAFDIYHYLRPYMYDILCTIALGDSYNLFEDRYHPYLVESQKLSKMVTDNYFSCWRNRLLPLFKLTSVYKEQQHTIKTVTETSEKIIKERRKKLGKKLEDLKLNNKGLDMKFNDMIAESDDLCLLDKLLLSKYPNGKPVPDVDIVDEVTLLSWTGHFTSSMTTSHALFCIASHPEVQEKVVEELRAVVGNDKTRPLTKEDLSQMKYLDAAIKESIRHIPTVTEIGRALQNDLKLSDGRIVPADTAVVVHYEALFMNPKSFVEPEKFNPDRFLNPVNTFAFVPFSAGPRNCIGFRLAWQNIKSTVANIVRSFEMEYGGVEPVFAHRLITESTTGIHIKLRERAF